MEEQHSFHAQHDELIAGSLQTRLHQYGLTPFSTPEYVKTSDFLSLRTLNAPLLKASERHFQQLFARTTSHETAVFICDASGVLIDSFGDIDMLSQLAAHGIYPMLITSEDSCGNNVFDISIQFETSAQLLGPNHYLTIWKRWHWCSTPIILDSGRVVGVCAVATTSTDGLQRAKMLSEASSVAIANFVELQETKQNLTRIHHTIISQLDYHVFFVDAHATVLDERHPIPISELARSEMRQIVSSGLTLQKEMLIDNRIYMVDVRKLTDYKGECQGTLGLFRDMSQDKRWETQLRDMEKMSTLNALAAGIAHEIRNPLTAAKGFLQLFTEKMQGSEDQRFLDLTLTELDRINALVKDFMSLARPEPPTYTDTDLHQVVRDLVQFIQPEAALRNVVFDVHLPTCKIWVWGDSNQLKQVLLNVVQNALQACGNIRGKIDITLQALDVRAIITVRDSGPGMTQQQLQRLFQPFYTTKETGTGLGLTISRQIIEEHGGSISVDSVAGVGTTVTISLDVLSTTVLRA